MPLYLGKKLIDLNIGTKSAVKCVTGTAIADDEGKVEFPPLYFTPNLIVVWNAHIRDMKAEAEASGEEWYEDENLIRYLHAGIIVTAVNVGGTWIGQGIRSGSSEFYLTGATANTHFDESDGCVFVQDGTYYYRILQSDHIGYVDLDGEEFNYAIYG